MGSRTFAFVVLTLGFVHGSVIRHGVDFKCVQTCPQSDSEEYRWGTDTRIYSFESRTQVQLDKSGSWVKIGGNVAIRPQDSCNFELNLHKVSLEDSDPGKNDGAEEFRRTAQRFPLRFGFSGGKILAVCPAGEEPEWILNIKKGILSTLQNTLAPGSSQSKKLEHDVLGNCVTRYEVVSESGVEKTVKKTKDLLSCRDRASYSTSIQSTPFSGLQDESAHSIPVLGSTNKCVQTFKRRYLEQVQCEEVHTFQPFSRGGEGARTVSTITLSYTKSVSPHVRNSGVHFERGQLRFASTPTKLDSTSASEKAKRIIESLCAASEDELWFETPSQFNELLETLQHVRDLDTINNFAIQRCPAGSRLMQDAVKNLNTGEGFSLVKRMIREKEVGNAYAESWYSSLPYRSHVDQSMIGELRDLFETNDKNAILGASSLVFQFCRSHENCAETREVKEILGFLERKLGRSCHIKSKDADHVLLVLKAIGNMGQTRSPQLLANCASYSRNPLAIRLAGIESFRRMDCNTDRRPLFHLLENQASTQLRVAAYLKIAQCPTPAHVRKIIRYLHKQDADSTVGQFIMSHLLRIREGARDPSHRQLKSVLEKEVLPHHMRKPTKMHPSKYVKFSKFFDDINSGAWGEGYAVFGRNKMTPKQGMLNLTISLFGRAVNVLEVGGHAEGLEGIEETLFGKKGRYPNKGIVQLLRRTRSKRSIKNDHKINGIGYVKIFGNEIAYTKLEDLEKFASRNAQLGLPQDLLGMLARPQKESWSKHVRFLDSSLTVPTISGLPLQLKLDGTATLNFGIDGKADLRNLMEGELDVNGALSSAASIQIQGSMIVDSFHSKSGLKFSSSLNHASKMEGRAEMKEGEELKIRWKTPKEKIFVSNLKSELFLVHRDSMESQAPKDNKEIVRCSGKSFSKYIGFELCGKVSQPRLSSSLPYLGPVSASFYLQKTDNKITEYTLDAKFTPYKEEKTFRFALDSPGSEVNRRIVLHGNLNPATKEGLIEIDTPIKKLSVTGKYEANLKREQALLELNVDGVSYDALAKLELAGKGSTRKYSPSLKVRSAGRELVYIGGDLEKGNDWVANLFLRGLTSKQITLTGAMNQEKSRKNGNMQLNLPQFDVNMKYNFHPQLERDSNKFTGGLEFDLVPPSGPKKTVAVGGKILQNANGIKVTAENINSWVPQFNGFANLEALNSYNEGSCAREISFTASRVKNDKDVEIIALAKQETIQNGVVQSELGGSFILPKNDVKYAILGKSQYQSMTTLKASLNVDYDKSTKAKTWFEIDRQSKAAGAALGLEAPGMYHQIKADVVESKPKSYSVEAFWETGKNRKSKTVPWKATALYQDKSSAQVSQHKITGELAAEGRAPFQFRIFHENRDKYFDLATKGSVGKDSLTGEVHYDLTDGEHNIKCQLKRTNGLKALVKGSIGGPASDMKSNFHFNLNDRHTATAKGRFTQQTAMLSLNANTGSKSYMMETELEKVASTTKFVSVVKGPNVDFLAAFNTTNVKASHHYATNAIVRWSPAEAMEMKVGIMSRPHPKTEIVFTTPFVALREIRANGHRRNSEFLGEIKLQSQGHDFETKWSGNVKNQASRTTFNSQVLSRSTVTGYKKGIVTLKHTIVPGKEFESTAQMEWGKNKEAKLRAHGTTRFMEPAAIIDGGVEFTSPFESAEKLGLLLSHRQSGQGIHTDLALQTAPKIIHKMKVVGKVYVDSKERIADADVVMEPHGMDKWRMAYKHRNTNSELECNLRGEQGRAKYVEVGIKAHLQQVNKLVSVGGTTDVKTHWFPHFQIGAGHRHTLRPFSHDSHFTINSEGRDEIVLKVTGECENKHPRRFSPKVHHLFQFGGHHDLPQIKSEFNLDWSHSRGKMMPLNWTTDISLDGGRVYKLDISHSHKMGPYAHESRLTASGNGVTAFEIATFGSCENKVPGQYTPIVKQFLEVFIQSDSKFKTDFDLDFSSLNGVPKATWLSSYQHDHRRFEVKIHHSHLHPVGSDFRHNSKLEIHRHVRGHRDADKLLDAEAKGSVSFGGPDSIKGTWEGKLNQYAIAINHDHTVRRGQLEFGYSTYNTELTLKEKGQKDLTSSFKLELSPKNSKLDLQLWLKKSTGLEWKVTTNMPNSRLNDLRWDAALTLDGAKHAMKVEHSHDLQKIWSHKDILLVTSNERQMFELNADGEIKTVTPYPMIRGLLKIKLYDAESFETKLLTTLLDPNRWEAVWSGNVNGEIIRMTNTISPAKITKSGKDELKFELKTPFNGPAKKIDGTFTFSALERQLHVGGDMSWHNGGSAKFNSEMQHTPRHGFAWKMDGGLGEWAKPMSADIKIHIPGRAPHFIDSYVKFFDGRIERSVIAKLHHRNHEGKTMIELFYAVPTGNFGVIAEHKTGRKSQDTVVELLFGSKKIELRQELQVASPNFVINTKITTPFPEYEESKLKFDLDLKTSVDGKLSSELKFYKWEATHKTQWTGLENGYRASSEMAAIESGKPLLSFMVKSNGEFSREHAKGQLFSVQWSKDPSQLKSAQKVELSYSARKIEGGAESDFHLKTLNDLYNMEAHIRPSKEGKSIHVNMNRDSDSKRIASTLHINSMQRKSVSFLVETPFEDWAKASVSCAADGERLEDFEVVCAVKKGQRSEVDVAFDFKLLRSHRQVHGFDTSIEIKVPSHPVEELVLRTSTEGFSSQPKQFGPTAQITLKWGAARQQQTISSTASWKNPQKEEHVVKFSLATPITDFQKLEAEWEHSHSAEKERYTMNSFVSLNEERKFSVSGHVGWRSMKLEATTPFGGFEKQSVSGDLWTKYDQKSKEETSTLRFSSDFMQSNPQKLSVLAQIRRNNNNKCDGSIKLTTPFYNWEDREILFQHNYNPNFYVAEIRMNDADVKQWEVALKHDFPQPSKAKHTGFLKIYYPYGLHSISKITYELKQSQKDLFTKLQWVANNRVVSDTSFELANDGGMMDFYADNLWQPIQAKYLVSAGPENAQVEGTFCWNLREAEDSTVQVKLSSTYISHRSSPNMNHTLNVRQADSLTVAVPTRTIGFKRSETRNLDSVGEKMSQSYEIIWDLVNEGRVGYEFTRSFVLRKLESKVSLKVWHPLDQSQITAKASTDRKSSSLETVVKYSMTRNPRHVMGLKAVVESKDLPRHGKLHRTLSLTAKHPSLAHNLLWTTEMICQSGSESVHIGRTALTYSRDPNKKLTAEVRVGRSHSNQSYFMSFNGFHKDSHLDSHFSASIRPTARKISVSVQNRRNQMIYALSIDREANTFELKTLDNHWFFQLQCDAVCVIIDKADNDRKILEIYVDPSEVDFHFYPKSPVSDFYRLRSRFQDKVIGVEGYRSKDGHKIHDFALKAKLDQPKHIKAHAHLRPGFFNDASAALSGLQVSDFGLRSSFIEASSHLSSRLAEVKRQLKLEVVDRVSEDYNRGVRQINQDGGLAKQAFDEAVARDDFYLRSIRISHFGHCAAEAVDMLGNLVNHMIQECRPLFASLGEGMDRVMGYLSHIEHSLMLSGLSTLRASGDAVEYIRNHEVWDEMSSIADKSTQKLLALKQNVHDLSRENFRALSDYFDTFYREYVGHPALVAAREQWVEIEEQLEDWVMGLEESVDDAIESTLDQAPWLRQNSVIGTVLDFWKLLKNKVSVVLEYWGMRTSAKSYLLTLFGKLRDVAIQKFNKVLQCYTGYKPTTIKYKPEEGRVDVSLWSPVEIRSLKNVPSPNTAEDLQSFTDALNAFKANSWAKLKEIREMGKAGEGLNGTKKSKQSVIV